MSIEEPFSILALEAICESALDNVRELQAVHASSALKGVGGGPRRPMDAGRLVAVTTAEAAARSWGSLAAPVRQEALAVGGGNQAGDGAGTK